MPADFTSTDWNDKIAAIDAAIANALEVQRLSVGPKSKTNAELTQLMEARKFAEMMLAKQNGSYNPRVVQRQDPS